MSRTGKIARLPRALRDELNRRLEQGLVGRTLVAWLNSLPEVQEVLFNHFDGKPIREQNLSEWRLGGYAEWLAGNELLHDARAAAESSEDLEKNCGLLADHAARLISARFAVAFAQWNGDPLHPAFSQLRYLLPYVNAIARLRRGDHHAARLRKDLRPSNHPVPAPSPPAPTPPPPPPPPPVPSSPPIHPFSSSSLPLFPSVENSSTASVQAGSTRRKPDQTHVRKPRRPKSRLPKSQSPAPVSSSPEPSPTPPQLAIPSDIVTEKKVTIAPAPALPPKPAPPPPISDEELWQMRNRDLPGDSPPAWRVQLQTQVTIPPWLQAPSYEFPPPPVSILAHTRR